MTNIKNISASAIVQKYTKPGIFTNKTYIKATKIELPSQPTLTIQDDKRLKEPSLKQHLSQEFDSSLEPLGKIEKDDDYIKNADKIA